MLGFRHSLIRFHKKGWMTKSKISQKDAENYIDEGFSWVSCDILSFDARFQAFFD